MSEYNKEIVSKLLAMAERETYMEAWFDSDDARVCREAADLIMQLTPKSEQDRYDILHNQAAKR